MKRTALITGGTRGIGLAISRAIVDSCDRLILGFCKDEESAARVAHELSSTGKDVYILRGDLSVKDELLGFIERVRSIGSPDILINNAGAIYRPSSWLEQSYEDFSRSMNLNFLSAAILIREFAPQMRQNKYGRIINVSSTYAFTGSSAVLSYTCAKAALMTLTTAMARELGKDGITVNCIAPGNIDTEMTAAAGQAIIDWAISTTPVGRLGLADEVGSAAKYLIESSFVTGTVMPIDGGQILNF
ncbi:MAG: SDR family NAD(P)-dependent oxidoreductase [Pseudomonadota bacterium]